MMRKMTHKLSVPVIINNQGIGVSVPELVVPFYRHEKGGGMLLVVFFKILRVGTDTGRGKIGLQ